MNLNQYIFCISSFLNWCKKCTSSGYLKAETMLPIKLNLPIVLTALLAVSGIAQTVQHYRLKSVQTQLAYAKTDLETSRSELNQANERAAALQAANQQMMQQLAAAQAEAAVWPVDNSTAAEQACAALAEGVPLPLVLLPTNADIAARYAERWLAAGAHAVAQGR